MKTISGSRRPTLIALVSSLSILTPLWPDAAAAVDAAPTVLLPARYRTVVFGCYSETFAAFETFARRAREAGATHIVLTAEDLPRAMWPMDRPGDPYSAWAVSNVALLKIAIPAALQPYLPADYLERVLQILAERCAVPHKLGLKATFTTFEPQMLPEAVFRDNLRWRGPQMDEPFRSRMLRFAPDADHTEVLELYRESMRLLVQRCQEIETVSPHTNNSGSSTSWSGGLYPIATEGRPMHQRYRDFLAALQAGASDAGVANLQLDVA